MTGARLAAILTAALVLAQPAWAQGPAEGLQPLHFLLGHCWRGEFPGGKADTHCFEPVYGGKHIRDRHEVTGGKDIYRGETIYSWNAKLGRVEYTYWNSLGGVSRGTMVPREVALDFGDQVYTGSDGKVTRIATTWRPGAGSYDVVSTMNGVTGSKVTTYTRVER